MTEDLGALGAEATAHAIAVRRISSREVVEAAIERALRWQASIRAFVSIFAAQALAAADRADAAVSRGEPLGPLHGVPVACKDMYYRAGRVSGCGTQSEMPAATCTSTLLERLDRAGAIELGTLHMCEFALGPTGHNSQIGDCRNPWDLRHVPGGSSSGAGASVAARIVPAALGSDTGGSIRLPASACGVLGLKPTHGMLSRYGAMPLAPSLDTPGLCARSSRDLALMLDVLAGHDANDAQTSRRSPASALAALKSDATRPLTSLRIGVPREYFREQVSADVSAALDASLERLASLGAVVVDADVPDSTRLSELNRVLVYAEAAAVHSRRLAERSHEYSPQVRIRAATGFAIPAPVYSHALALRPRLLREFVTTAFAGCDVLHVPTLAMPVPTLEETDVGREAAMWDTIAAMVRFTAPFNYLGLPALSVPCGWTRNGLPASFQLVGRPFAESTLLQVSHAYEIATGWLQRSPAPPAWR